MNPVTNFRAIVSGYKNFVFPTKTMETLAKARAKVCSKCEHVNPEYPFKKLLGDGESIQEIKGMGCNRCGCLLSAKTRQLFSDCPEKKWG